MSQLHVFLERLVEQKLTTLNVSKKKKALEMEKEDPKHVALKFKFYFNKMNHHKKW